MIFEARSFRGAYKSALKCLLLLSRDRGVMNEETLPEICSFIALLKVLYIDLSLLAEESLQRSDTPAHANADVSSVWRDDSSEKIMPETRFHVGCFDLRCTIIQAGVQESMQNTRRHMRESTNASSENDKATVEHSSKWFESTTLITGETDSWASLSLEELSIYPAVRDCTPSYTYAWYTAIFKDSIAQPLDSVVASRDAVSRMIISLETAVDRCVSKRLIEREAVFNHMCFEMMRLLGAFDASIERAASRSLFSSHRSANPLRLRVLVITSLLRYMMGSLGNDADASGQIFSVQPGLLIVIIQLARDAFAPTDSPVSCDPGILHGLLSPQAEGSRECVTITHALCERISAYVRSVSMAALCIAIDRAMPSDIAGVSKELFPRLLEFINYLSSSLGDASASDTSFVLAHRAMQCSLAACVDAPNSPGAKALEHAHLAIVALCKYIICDCEFGRHMRLNCGSLDVARWDLFLLQRYFVIIPEFTLQLRLFEITQSVSVVLQLLYGRIATTPNSYHKSAMDAITSTVRMALASLLKLNQRSGNVRLELGPPRSLGKELVKAWIVIRNAKRKNDPSNEDATLSQWLDSLSDMFSETIRLFAKSEPVATPSAMELAIDEFKERLPGFHAELMKTVTQA